MNQTGKTTILFVNKGPQVLKPLQVSNRILLHWKKYVALALLAFITLIGITVFLAVNNLQQYQFRQNLSNKITAMHHLLEQSDTTAVRQKFMNIDKNLSIINDYLKARGIQSSVKIDLHDSAGNKVQSTVDITNNYDSYLDKVVYNILYTPLGLPFHGPITSHFGQRENPFGGSSVETHKGLDIKGPMGGEVRCMAKGIVEFAGQKNGFGNCIVLKHGNGFETLYGHLSKIMVRVGEQVDIGEQIGAIGSTGRSTGPHLHYEVHHNGQKINPALFLTLN